MIGIIPAAGKGMRFKELGKHYSKTILPYKEKPILIHQIEWLERQGCKEIRVVLNHQEETVQEILEFYNKNVTIKRQEERNGLAGAVYVAIEQTDADDYLILLGDLVITEDIHSSFFEGNAISVQEVQEYSRWCMVKNEGNGVLKFFDKPQDRPDTNLAVSGVYFITQESNLGVNLQQHLSNPENKIAGEYQISTVLQWIADNDGMHTMKLNLIDFGTLEEYLENRSVKNSRSFNDIEASGPFIIKSSEEAREKLIAEYNWFINLPDEIKVCTPRIFSRELFASHTWYKMEKILAPSLREIYLFLDSSEETWDCIFESIFCTLSTMERFGQKNLFMRSVVQKTKSRVKDIDVPVQNKLVNHFIEELEQQTQKFSRPALMHGDFCFSNLFYDFQSSTIKMIDPRGELFGDHYYEVAKIMHSVMYDYDFVDAELYVKDGNSYKIYNNGKTQIKELFLKKINKYYQTEEIQYIRLICASLFLSMIPLHSHNKNNQEIYYDIFKIIYEEYKQNDLRITGRVIP